jgi:hypothetical protein
MGGFFNFILKFTAMLLNRYQNFTIDKSMVKKLYTREKDDAHFDLA